MFNEMRVWDLIELKCRIALERIPMSLDEYDEILAKDDREKNLSFNERNAVKLMKKHMEMYLELGQFANSLQLFEMRLMN